MGGKKIVKIRGVLVLRSMKLKQFETVIGSDLDYAKECLVRGDAIGMPTETVYGLAANALNADAVLNIFAVKERPNFDPLIVHIKAKEEVVKYALEFNPLAQLLAETFWPGPLTILLPKRDVIPDEVTSGLSRVALRVPGHPMARKLLEVLDFPLSAPSANPFGYISPTTSQHVVNQLSKKIPYVLEGGNCNVGVESTIVGFEDDNVVVYRLGGTPLENIEKTIGDRAKVVVQRNQSSDPANPSAPGMLKSHYSPKKKLTVIETGAVVPRHDDKVKVGLISLVHRDDVEGVAYQMSLCKSDKPDPNEAAKNLFASLRFMDDTDKCDVIYVEKCVNIGLGRAINDRLGRAACQE